MNKKIMFLCEYKSLYSGNFIASLIELENELNKQGSNCIYVFPKESESRQWFKELINRGKKVFTISFTKSKFEMAKRISSIANEYDIDVLHTHFCNLTVVELYTLLFKKKNIKVIFHIHSDFSLGKENLLTKIKDFIKYKFLAYKCKFISVSSYIAKKNTKRIVYIPNALATNRLFPNSITREEMRKNLLLSDNQILCMVYGWEPRIKGVDIALKAIANCNKNNEDKYILGIVCGREVTKDKMKEFIKNNTSLTGEEKYLRYLEPIEDVFSYHKASDLLLMTSRSEAFSYTLLEMLSLGKKCVVSKLPSLSWASKYKENVLFFESENENDCSKKILEATNCNNLINEKIAESVQNDYQISDWVERIIEVYNI